MKISWFDIQHAKSFLSSQTQIVQVKGILHQISESQKDMKECKKVFMHPYPTSGKS
jgi:hypothetical protein